MFVGPFVLHLLIFTAQAEGSKQVSLPSFDYALAEQHDLKPHRRTTPHDGVNEGFHQLHLKLIVTAAGTVQRAAAEGDADATRFWPDLKGEVFSWKFEPFEANGKPTEAEVEEYIDLVPPERLPKRHIPGPPVRPDSEVSVTLERTGCFGSCPSYVVRIGTNGIEFDGRGYVVAAGKHTAKINPAAVRHFAKRIVASDFYSMDPVYRAGVTDSPTYVLSISVDGHKKTVEDYVGSWVGMPAVVSELEDEADELAQTKRWIKGGDGLVDALRAEGFNFKTYTAQVMVKEAATRGQTETVQDFLDAGVPLKPVPPPKQTDEATRPAFENVGWLNAASRNPATLKVLLDAGASRTDQRDLNMALLNAARAGKLESVRQLIEAGADPNADFSDAVDEITGAGMTIGYHGGAGSVLIGAATSGNPDVVREILRYHPMIEERDRQGRTALIEASEDSSNAPESARAECVRLLVDAGADVNAHDKDGNTALHETFLTAVEKELLTLGADVNARNNRGETSIFTTVDDSAIPLYIQHGANLELRNDEGQTAMEAAGDHGPLRVEAFRKALQNRKGR